MTTEQMEEFEKKYPNIAVWVKDVRKALEYEKLRIVEFWLPLKGDRSTRRVTTSLCEYCLGYWMEVSGSNPTTRILGTNFNTTVSSKSGQTKRAFTRWRIELTAASIEPGRS